MSYGDKPDAWSSCSNADFATWYREEGFECLDGKNNFLSQYGQYGTKNSDQKLSLTQPPSSFPKTCFSKCF
jgi:hypothetical protein